MDIGNEVRCPAGCAAESSSHVKVATREFLGITKEVAEAARLGPNDDLFVCLLCGCVWRRLFDAYVLRYRQIAIGTSTSLTRFCPASWLNQVLIKKNEAHAKLCDGPLPRT